MARTRRFSGSTVSYITMAPDLDHFPPEMLHRSNGSVPRDGVSWAWRGRAQRLEPMLGSLALSRLQDCQLHWERERTDPGSRLKQPQSAICVDVF